jgi:polar amino acid transport system permease protein
MQWDLLWTYRLEIWQGLLMTLQLSVLSIIGSFVLGTGLGSLAATPGFFAPRVIGLYVTLMRNLPVLVKLFFFYFVLGLDAVPAAVIALTAHQSAYIADLVAAGFRAVPKEQFEAAWSSGLQRLQIVRQILLPQVLRVVAPPMTSQFIEVLKNSATAMLIGIEELTFETQHIESETFRGFEAATLTTVLYVVLALAIVAGVAALSRLAPQPVRA